MSIDVYLEVVRPVVIYKRNITQNLNRMAKEAGIYEVLWRPEEEGITRAARLIEPLQAGLARLKSDPERYRKLDPENGWDTYERLVSLVQEYLEMCGLNPEATVRVWR
jgi:hypothetical protein